MVRQAKRGPSSRQALKNAFSEIDGSVTITLRKLFVHFLSSFALV
jgi:hypothetical protein